MKNAGTYQATQPRTRCILAHLCSALHTPPRHSAQGPKARSGEERHKPRTQVTPHGVERLVRLFPHTPIRMGQCHIEYRRGPFAHVCRVPSDDIVRTSMNAVCRSRLRPHPQDTHTRAHTHTHTGPLPPVIDLIRPRFAPRRRVAAASAPHSTWRAAPAWRAQARRSHAPPQKATWLCFENPSLSRFCWHANLTIGGGPHMRTIVSSPGLGRCSEIMVSVMKPVE